MERHDPRETAVRRNEAWRTLPLMLGELTTEECSVALAGPHATVILPLGSTEPHGPHLPLCTDAVLAVESARRAAETLRVMGVAAVVAPPLAYGVTRFAAGFAGAISLSPVVLEQLVRELCDAYRDAGFALVCATNHHLEPEHVSAVSRAVIGTAASRGGAVYANQLSARWGRTLSAEFKRGDCHAGAYESSLVMAAQPSLVRDQRRRALPALSYSLSEAIREGKATFREIGMTRAYTGAPAEATPEEGEDLYARLTTMVVTEVREALGI
jgi:creatinine amidohydrolase